MASAANITRTVESTPSVRNRTAEGGQTRSGRPVEIRTMVHGSVTGREGPREGGVERSARPEDPTRTLTDRQRSMLASVDKHGDFREVTAVAPAEPTSAASDGGAAAGAGASDGATAASGASAAAPSEPAPATSPAAAAPDVPAKPEPAKVETPEKPATPAAPAPDAEPSAREKRLAEHNRKLVEELEKHKGKARHEPDDRIKALDEIERGLTTDFIGSIRKLVALNAGIKDPSAPEVDRLMAGGYAEWTADELKMQMDPGQRAAIGTERNRLLIERDKRDREAAEKAREATAAEEAEKQRHATIARQLGGHLETAKHGERFPLMMKHAELVDRAPAGEILWSEIRRGIAAGEFPPEATDAELINHYSKQIETRYQALRDALAAAPTSTAAPAPATVSTTDNKASAPPTAENQGARTITNASASVAPATPPAATTTAPADKEAPKRRPGESEDSFRKRAAIFHFGAD